MSVFRRNSALVAWLATLGASVCIVGALTGHAADLNTVGTTLIGGALGIAMQGAQAGGMPAPGGKP